MGGRLEFNEIRVVGGLNDEAIFNGEHMLDLVMSGDDELRASIGHDF